MLLQKKFQSEKIDSWSLGSLLFYLLTKKHPFPDEILQKALPNIQAENLLMNDPEQIVAWIKSHKTMLCPMAYNFITKLVAVNPEQRMNLSEALLYPYLRS